MTSKLYRVMVAVQDEILATSEAEAVRFLLLTASQTRASYLGLEVTELPMGTGDFYSDEEE